MVDITGITLTDIDVEGVDKVQGGTPYWFFNTTSKMTDMEIPEILEKIAGERDAVMYEFDVKAVNQAVAEQKCRIWVRAHNPFTPSLIRILRSREKAGNSKMSRGDYTIRLVIER